ncbi:MAG: protein kinase [Candidatus Riflebacteria bacterium]|nr:protein kinase [Candidatus Riflebacteria bacterium]
MDLTSFLLSSVSGNVLLQAFGSIIADVSIDKAAALWNRFNIGHDDLEKALATAFQKTFSCLELMLTPPGALGEAFARFLPATPEKSQAKVFAEKILRPFLNRTATVITSTSTSRNASANTPADNDDFSKNATFLRGSAEMCRFFRSSPQKVLSWNELVKSFPAGVKPLTATVDAALPNQRARATFRLISAVMFAGNDLAEAPDLKRELESASRLLMTKLQATGRETARQSFATAPDLETRFYDLLRERHLFMTGLTYFLEREISANPEVASQIRAMADQDAKLNNSRKSEIEKNERNASQRELLENLESLRAEVRDVESRIVARQAKSIPVRTLEMDLLELRNSLAPLEQQFSRLDVIERRLDGWKEVSRQMTTHREYFVEAFGTIFDKLDEIAVALERQQQSLSVIDSGINDIRTGIGEVKQDTGELKVALGELLTIKSWERIEKKYELLGTVGHGQFGIVFKVRSRSGGDIRALKVLRSDAGLDADVKRRFMNEACTAYELAHTNVVRVHDVDPIGGFFEMDFLAGKTLREALRSRPEGLPDKAFFHITYQLLDGLEYLHRDRHLAHRDLKPENIMLVPDETGAAILTDLGAITNLDLVRETTGLGLAGTAIYMAPEQFDGEKSPRIDIYAIGVLMYEMVCGVPPFSGGNFLEISRRHAMETPAPPSARGCHIDSGLEAVILKCLAKRPEDRFPSVGDIREALGSRTGESERERRDRERHEEALLDALKLAWSAGEKSDEASAFLEEKRRELGIEETRAHELETSVITRPEIAARIEARKIRAVEEKNLTFVNLLRGLWRKGFLDAEDRAVIDEEAKRLRIAPDLVISLNRKVQDEPEIKKRQASIATEEKSTSTGNLSPTSSGSTLTVDKIETKIVADVVRTAVSEDAFTAQNAHRLHESMRFGRGRLFQAIVSQDRRMVIVASSTGVHFYDTDQLLPIRSVSPGVWVTSIALSPDGRTLAGACKDGSILLLDVTTGKEIVRCTSHEGEATSVAFLPDGGTVISGGWDGTVRFWQASSGNQIRKIAAHGMSVNGVAVSGDGGQIASASWDGTIKLFETASGIEKKVFTGHTGVVQAVAFVPGGIHLLSGGGDKTARLWNLETGKEELCLTGHAGPVTAVCTAFGGRFILTASGDRTIRAWNPLLGEEIMRFTGHTQSVQSIAVSSNNRFVLSGGTEGAVIIWDTSTANRLQTLEGHLSQVRTAALADNRRVLITGGLDGRVHVWDFTTGRIMMKLDGHTASVNAVIVSRDGRIIVSAGGDRTIRIWDSATGAETRKITGHGDWVNAVALSPDGRLLYSGSNDGTLRLWDVSTGKERLKFEGHQGRVNSVALAPDGCMIVSGGRDGTIRIWDTATGEEMRRMEGFISGITSVAISGDGKFIIAGGGDGVIHIRGFATGKDLKRFSGHQGSVTTVCVHFEGDRRIIVSGGMDKTIRIWDFTAGREIRKLEGHADLVNAVLVTPDNTSIISASWDGTIRVWRLMNIRFT